MRFLFLLLALAGCAVGPQLRPHEVRAYCAIQVAKLVGGASLDSVTAHAKRQGITLTIERDSVICTAVRIQPF